MKKNLQKFLCALLLMGTVTSCFDFDEVYLLSENTGDEGYAEQQATLKLWEDSILHFKEKALTQFATDRDNPDVSLAQWAPDIVETLADGTQVGYVDMGTSVYWAVMNIGDEMHAIEPVDSVWPMPQKPTLKKGGSSKTVPLLDYANGKKSTGSNTELINSYITACKAYMDYSNFKTAYRAACIRDKWTYMYNTNLMRFLWGSNEPYVDGAAVNLSTLPDELTSASNDAATKRWGAGWQTPTADMVKELLDNCQAKLHTVSYSYIDENRNRVAVTQYGALFTSKTTKKQLFFPTPAKSQTEYYKYHFDYLTTHRLDNEHFQVFVVGKDHAVNFTTTIADSPSLVRPVKKK